MPHMNDPDERPDGPSWEACLERTRAAVLNVLVADAVMIAVSGWLLRRRAEDAIVRASRELHDALLFALIARGGRELPGAADRAETGVEPIPPDAGSPVLPVSRRGRRDRGARRPAGPRLWLVRSTRGSRASSRSGSSPLALGSWPCRAPASSTTSIARSPDPSEPTT